MKTVEKQEVTFDGRNAMSGDLLMTPPAHNTH